MYKTLIAAEPSVQVDFAQLPHNYFELYLSDEKIELQLVNRVGYLPQLLRSLVVVRRT